MKENAIHTYLRTLKWELWRRELSDPDMLAEIESHLLESVERGLRCGLTQEESEQAALERFGSVKLISATFEREKERMRPMQKILITVAVLAGLFFAYVDSRPTWDDTGVLVAAILLVSGLIALLGYKRPWLLALAVGGWIPLHGILVSHNAGSIVALIIAFAGAYIGKASRIGIRKVQQLT
jgi:hypothetical protein